MKRRRADLDPHPTSPTPKKSRKAIHDTSNLEGRTLASQTSTASSTSTLLGSPPTSPPPQHIPSSELDYSSSDTSSSTSSDSASTSSDSSDLDDSSDSLSESSGPGYRNQHLTGAEIAEAISAYANATDSDSDSDSDPSSLSSTSAYISDHISESSSPGSDSALDATSPSSPSSASTSSSSASSSSYSAASDSDRQNHTSVLSTENLSTLQSRLSELLPKMRSANKELELERAEGTLGERDIENVEEEEEEEGGGEYIEMDLGLGVLEERRNGVEEESEESESEVDAGDGHEGGDEKEDVMGKLLGSQSRKGKRKIKIEDLSRG